MIPEGLGAALLCHLGFEANNHESDEHPPSIQGYVFQNNPPRWRCFFVLTLVFS